jgi:YD repeat-containing protein
VQGRLTSKQYPDTSTVAYTYETTTSRLKSVTDALSQVKTYGYARDDQLTAIIYTGAVNPTPNVSFTWDPYFPRLTAMTDGTGTTPTSRSARSAPCSCSRSRGRSPRAPSPWPMTRSAGSAKRSSRASD